jgi:hypothetical protein
MGGDGKTNAEEYAVTTQDVQDHASSLEGELEALRGSTEDVKEEQKKAVPSAEALADAMEREAEMAKEAREAQQERRDALREVHDPLFAIVEGNKALADAEKAVLEAEEEFGTGSAEYQTAVMDRAGVLADLEGTYRDLVAQGIDPTGAAARNMLEDLDIPPDVIDSIFGQFDELEANLEGRDFRMRVSVPNLFPAPTRDGGVGWDSRGRSYYHSGGVVPGQLGQEVPIMAQAGERITPRGGGDGGGDIVVQVDGREILRAVRNADRRYR